MRVDIDPREPRCRICRQESVRVAVNQLLDWRGVPVANGRKLHRVTYADILRDLEPLNEGRDQRDRVTYDCLRIHAKRHYEIDGIVKYWASRFPKDLRRALRPGTGRDL